MTNDADVQEQLAELEYRIALGELRMTRLQAVGQQLRDLGREVVQVERQLRCLDHALGTCGRSAKPCWRPLARYGGGWKMARVSRDHPPLDPDARCPKSRKAPARTVRVRTR
jgi:hypothetical protein